MPAVRIADRGRSRLLVAIVGLIVSLAIGEGIARRLYAFHRVPLTVEDPLLEYHFRPGAYSPFGHRVYYNRFFMRSQEMPRRKVDARELRVLVFGDSVVNAGPQIGQEVIATELARARLQRSLGRPITVGNVSAGSWGPPNHLAWVSRFGFLDADLAIFVYSSDDASDVPRFDGLPAGSFREPPLFALGALVMRFWARVAESERLMSRAVHATNGTAAALEAVRELFADARRAHTCPLLVLHAKASELEGEPADGARRLRELGEDAHVASFELAPALRDAVARDRAPFVDDIHLTASGQQVLAEALVAATTGALAGGCTASPPSAGAA